MRRDARWEPTVGRSESSHRRVPSLFEMSRPRFCNTLLTRDLTPARYLRTRSRASARANLARFAFRTRPTRGFGTLSATMAVRKRSKTPFPLDAGARLGQVPRARGPSMSRSRTTSVPQSRGRAAVAMSSRWEGLNMSTALPSGSRGTVAVSWHKYGYRSRERPLPTPAPATR